MCSRCSACYCWSAWPWPSALPSSSTTLRNSSTTTSTPDRNWGSSHCPGSTSITAPCIPWREPSSPTDRNPTLTTSTVSIIHDHLIICRSLTSPQQIDYLNIFHYTQNQWNLTVLRSSAIIVSLKFFLLKVTFIFRIPTKILLRSWNEYFGVLVAIIYIYIYTYTSCLYETANFLWFNCYKVLFSVFTV